jgi:hypothetical protein
MQYLLQVKSLIESYKKPPAIAGGFVLFVSLELQIVKDTEA